MSQVGGGALEGAAQALWRHSRDCARWGLCTEAAEAASRAVALRVRQLVIGASGRAEPGLD